MNYIYTRSEPPCVWCERVKGLLDSYGIPYEEHDINGDNATGFWALDFKSVPQVFLNNKHIGGFEATAKYLRGESE
jgi:glutaredoxin